MTFVSLSPFKSSSSPHSLSLSFPLTDMNRFCQKSFIICINQKCIISTSIPFFWQTWRYSFIEIFPSFNGSAESKMAVKAEHIFLLQLFDNILLEFEHIFVCNCSKIFSWKLIFVSTFVVPFLLQFLRHHRHHFDGCPIQL